MPVATQRPLVLSQCWLAEQDAHDAPAMPHWPFDWLAYATQAVPLQQPFGHEVELQPQVPVLVEQAVPLGQGAQLAPAFPHWFMLWLAYATQVVPLQQPFGHDVALQTHLPVASQVCPIVHELHVAPPTPQVCVLEVWQSPFLSQQPFGHDVALQTQAPFEQAWPVAQGVQLAPFVPQVWMDGGV
jgi:hypothetical protein